MVRHKRAVGRSDDPFTCLFPRPPPCSPRVYGIMGEFDNPSELVAAARRTYEAGYRRINGYSPYPIEELSEAIGFTRTLCRSSF